MIDMNMGKKAWLFKPCTGRRELLTEPSEGLLKLPSDKALIEDPVFRRYVELYAKVVTLGWLKSSLEAFIYFVGARLLIDFPYAVNLGNFCLSISFAFEKLFWFMATLVAFVRMRMPSSRTMQNHTRSSLNWALLLLVLSLAPNVIQRLARS